MTDHFALLEERRRPWLAADLLKQKFLALCARVHPDKIHAASDSEKSAAAKKFAELNAAYNCLAEPKSRLLHLLELELGRKPEDIRQIPPALADFFAQIAEVCHKADGFLDVKGTVTSPLLQVRLFERAQGWIVQLNSLQARLRELREELTRELKSLDMEWMENNPPETRAGLLQKLEETYRLLGYYNRWDGQIQERIVQLTS